MTISELADTTGAMRTGLGEASPCCGDSSAPATGFFVSSNELAAQPWLSLPVVFRWAFRHALRAPCSRLEDLGT